MTDNLLLLMDLQADMLLADLNEKTKRCSITWDRVSPTTYHCYFEWRSSWYDAYVTLMRGSCVFDLIKNSRSVLNISSHINNQVKVLYYVVTDTFSNYEIKQIIQDINTLTSCKNVLRESAVGGVVVGGDAVEAYYKHEIGGVTVGGTASLAGTIGGVSCGGTASVGDGTMLYIANANDSGSIESWRSNITPRTVLSDLTNISCVKTDVESGKIFWSQTELTVGSPSGTSISWCDIDGNNVETIVYLSTYDSIRHFDLDRVNKKIYLVADRNWDGGSFLVYHVMRCDYDGGNLQNIYNGTNLFISSPTCLTVDVNNEYVFWCDSYGLDYGAVHRSDLDGSNHVQLLSTTGYVRAICAYQNELYMGGSGLLAKTDLDGNDQELLSFLQLSVVASIDIDSNENMYIADRGVNKVFINDLTGNTRTAIVNDSDPRVSVCVPL